MDNKAKCVLAILVVVIAIFGIFAYNITSKYNILVEQAEWQKFREVQRGWGYIENITITPIPIVPTNKTFSDIYAGAIYKATAERQIDEKWTKIENSYQRKVDLIPNIVETTKGYINNETVYENLINARTLWVKANNIDEQMNAIKEVDSSLSVLMNLTENYLQLKSNENFISLHSQLESTDNQIAVARLNYNTDVRDYNTRFNDIPGYKPKQYLEGI